MAHYLPPETTLILIRVDLKSIEVFIFEETLSLHESNKKSEWISLTMSLFAIERVKNSYRDPKFMVVPFLQPVLKQVKPDSNN